MVLALESFPLDILYRAAIGWFLTPVYLRLFPGDRAEWRLFVFFLLVLVALRIVPGVLRRALPFSQAVKEVWAERRALARRYDSYQWRKLFGLGLGWLAQLVVSGENWSGVRIMAGACLVAGALGLAFWCKQSRSLAAQTNTTVPASA
jgi:hypothetical protein